jgi:hypothetical protein
MSFFKLTMKKNVALTMGLPYTMNFINYLRRFLVFSQVIIHKMSIYMKLVKIAMVQVIGFIEDERCFNNLIFIKSKLCNWLTTHLNLVVCMFVQQFYMLENFPYLEIVVTWRTCKFSMVLMHIYFLVSEGLNCCLFPLVSMISTKIDILLSHNYFILFLLLIISTML